MPGRTVTIELWLSEADQEVIHRRIAEMNEYIVLRPMDPPWTEEREISALVAFGLRELRDRYERAAQRARELEEIGITPSLLQSFNCPIPEWLQKAVGDPMEEFPADLAEQLKEIEDGS